MTLSRGPFLGLLPWTVLIFLWGCSLASAPAGKEPSIIVIRNHSGANLASASLREATRPPGQATHFGSVAPVPDGVAQSIVRPTNPPPFPREVAIEWRDLQGGAHRREVSLAALLKNATGVRGEALVFEIGPAENVRVILEYHTP